MSESEQPAASRGRLRSFGVSVTFSRSLSTPPQVTVTLARS